MDRLVVLESETLTVHFFNVESWQGIDDEFIENLGISSSNSHWMAGDIEILEHLGTIVNGNKDN